MYAAAGYGQRSPAPGPACRVDSPAVPADRFLVIGKNAVIGEEKFGDAEKGRQNVLYMRQRVRLYEWNGVYYVVEFYLDDDHKERVLRPYVGQ